MDAVPSATVPCNFPEPSYNRSFLVVFVGLDRLVRRIRMGQRKSAGRRKVGRKKRRMRTKIRHRNG